MEDWRYSMTLKNSIHNYDALFVFGAVMRWDSNGWHFPLIMEENEYAGRLVLGEWIAKAAAAISYQAPIILVSGGSNKHPKTGEICSCSVELAKLIVELGAPKDMVLPIGTNDAGHTIGNVTNLKEYLKKNTTVKKIGMLCPRFHMPRAMVMYYNDPYYLENGINLMWIEVEYTVLMLGHVIQTCINGIYSTPEAEICRRFELRELKAFLISSCKPKT